MRFRKSPLSFDRPPPLLGEHTGEILRELGLDDLEPQPDGRITTLEFTVARIPLPTPDDMTPEQRRVYDTIVTGPRGTLVGPLRAALHWPELAEKWQQLGELLRYRTSLPPADQRDRHPGDGAALALPGRMAHARDGRRQGGRRRPP